MKTTENTQVNEIGLFQNPNTETMVWRYYLASSFCKGKDVADVSAGFGYGSAILNALGAKSVVGYDIDKEAIQYAKRKYGRGFEECPVFFKELDITKKTGVPKDSFDTVVSIETFEHLEKDDLKTYLENCKSMVREGGTIMFTTPRRSTPTWEYKGGTLYEYSPKEFSEEITSIFEGANISFKGIVEQRVGPYNQLVSILSDDINNCRVMVGIIENVKKERTADSGKRKIV